MIVYFVSDPTGVQRKLHMDRQAPQKSTRSTENNNKLTTNRVPARNSPGKSPIKNCVTQFFAWHWVLIIGNIPSFLEITGNPVLRHSRSLPETGRGAMQKVSSITEKLSQMSVTSRTRSTVKPAVPMLKAGHGKSDFLGKSDDIPPAKRLTRKLVS